jgi:formylglycine-generating enzyme required for sulfatase activity/serine/threonine protein kinase
MSVSRWRRMSEVFESARSLPEAQRGSFLDGACGDDRELRREIEDLLGVSAAALEQTPSAEWSSATSAASAASPEMTSGGRIGGYRLVRAIASGGMGTVWEAEQETPHRRVALKVMRFGFASPEDVSRFRYEAEILGRLQHPGIAQVFEAGTHVAGTEVPYFAMEYIEGAKTILEYARERKLLVREKLELFLLVCDAVQHGHQKGVIHRDLKPSNILVDARGSPKIIDFGIARVVTADVAARTLQTQAGQILGTLQYMSPEQFGPDSGAVDTRSDVYALGVVLYELLVGRSPYAFDRMPIHEAARIVNLEPPIRPSSIDRSFVGDLEWIVLKAIDKDRDLRYASPSELSADIQRHLADEPVRAGPPSRIYQVRKFVARHRFGVGASALFVVLLVSGLVTSLYFRARSEEKALEAIEQARVATQRAEEVLSLSAIQDLKDLEDRADTLWPAEPEMLPKYEAWLADARLLIDGRAPDPAKGVKKRASLREHEAKLAEIRGRAEGSDMPSEGEDRWWHTQLSKLVSDLRELTDEGRGGLFSAGTSDRHGWGIVKRSEFARTIEERSVSGPQAKRRWDEAVAAIAKNPKYAGLALAPQIGLLPIGEDPDSRLSEFADLATGDPAERGADGKLVLNESIGLVFVLIPGGTFEMGAQKKDPNGANYDPQARTNESPVHEVKLSPYFLSKYEMTQAQWERFAGRNPSDYGPRNYLPLWNRAQKGWTALHPVEQVTWTQAMEVTARMGLTLPTEAQWENAARGGTTSPFYTGSDLASLRGAANLADEFGKSHGNEALVLYEKGFDDGNSVHAEIGSYSANPFGLHDVAGNMWEWCRDGYDRSPYGSGPAVDPVAPSASAPFRIMRGGSFADVVTFARSASRSFYAPDYQDNSIGLRPARAVRPSGLRPDTAVK